MSGIPASDQSSRAESSSDPSLKVSSAISALDDWYERRTAQNPDGQVAVGRARYFDLPEEVLNGELALIANDEHQMILTQILEIVHEGNARELVIITTLVACGSKVPLPIGYCLGLDDEGGLTMAGRVLGYGTQNPVSQTRDSDREEAINMLERTVEILTHLEDPVNSVQVLTPQVGVGSEC